MTSAYYADLGLTDYMDILRLQHELAALREKNSFSEKHIFLIPKTFLIHAV